MLGPNRVKLKVQGIIINVLGKGKNIERFAFEVIYNWIIIT